ncbi:MAG: hypothetical protein AMS25_16515 [Gemmatimonas sp. SM23_52]|nr:MAG: hypothetical protein AMS25_16515 [Gemmatimonas sp. SM23_52]
MDSVQVFFDLIRSYNTAIWPVHVLTLVLGVTALVLAVRKTRESDKIISGILAFLWLWSGVVFLMVFLGPWTPILLGFALPGFGYMSGALFIVQGIVFLWFGVVRSTLSFKLTADIHGVIGAVLIAYAVVIYPIVGYATGHPLPGYPVFGTAACPVAIFTVGMLLWTNRRMPQFIPVIPMIWGLAGILAVVAIKVWADVGLFIAGILGFVILRRNAGMSAPEPRPLL